MNLLDLMVKVGVEDNASSQLGAISEGAIAKATVIGNAFYDAAKFVAGRAVDMTKAVVGGAVDGYASYEQLASGMEKLYGDASDTVIADAQRAYSEVGMSANKYMENVAGFSASLMKSVGDDSQEAARLSNQAMKDIADNANTFGKYTAEELAGVYQALAKGQYQTLDNLNLGYGGTKEGMQQLIDKANELREANGELADLSIESFADIVDAIHLVQDDMDITGTTASEAMGTLEGSANAAKAAWENVLTAIGSGDTDMLDTAVSGLVDSIFGTFNEETGNREGGLAENLIGVLSRTAQTVAAEAPSIFESVAHSAIDKINEVFGTDIDAEEVFSKLGEFAERVKGFFTDLSSGFEGSADFDSFTSAFQNIMDIAGQVFDFLTENADSIGAAFGTAVTVLGTVADVFTQILEVVGPFVPMIIGVIAALSGLSAITGIITAISGAVTFFTTVLVPALAAVQSIPGLIALVTTVLGGPITVIVAIVAAIATFIATNEEARQAIADFAEAVVDKFNEFKEGVSKAWEAAKTAVTTTVSGIVTSAMSAFASLVAAISSRVSSIKSFISSGFNSARATVVNAATGMYTGVVSKFAAVLSYVRGIPGMIQGALGNLGSLLWNAGYNVMMGFKNGIVSGLTAAVNAAKSAASSVVSAAKSALGIKSPSKVFEQIGEYTMEGFQIGLEKAFKSDVVPFVGDMAGSVGSMFDVPMQSAATTPDGGSGSVINIFLQYGADASAKEIVYDIAHEIELIGLAGA